MITKILTITAVIFFITVWISNRCNKFYLTIDFSVYISRYKNSLNLYCENKNVNYIVLSVGNINKWYVLCKDKVYIVYRFKNHIAEYTYFDIPSKDFNYLSGKLDMSYFQKNVNNLF